MKTAKILTGLATLIAVSIAAHGQYTYTALDFSPTTGGTYDPRISGTDIVGYCTDSNGITHGFLATPTRMCFRSAHLLLSLVCHPAAIFVTEISPLSRLLTAARCG